MLFTAGTDEGMAGGGGCGAALGAKECIGRGERREKGARNSDSYSVVEPMDLFLHIVLGSGRGHEGRGHLAPLGRLHLKK